MEKTEKNKILITGGAGYIGSHVNKLLNKNGYETVVVDSLVRGNKKLIKWGNFEKVCLSNQADLDKIFVNYNISTVMHFAAFAYVGESVYEPSLYYNNNVSNTINLLNTMIKHNVKKFIFSSSCATYGIPKKLPLTEKSHQKPINPYGKTKLIIEDILYDYDKAYELKYINLRYFNAAGCEPEGEIGELHEPETHIIPRVINAALSKNKIFQIYGNDYSTKDGTCVRDFVHVDDVASAHLCAMEYLIKHNKSDSFNIGIGKGYSIKEVIDCVEKYFDKKINVIYSARRDGDPAELFSNNDKAISILEWYPNYNDLDDIIKTAADWFVKLNNQK